MESFEEKIEMIEKLIDALENEKLSLDASMENYKKGAKLISECNQYIDKAEEELEIINKEA